MPQSTTPSTLVPPGARPQAVTPSPGPRASHRPSDQPGPPRSAGSSTPAEYRASFRTCATEEPSPATHQAAQRPHESSVAALSCGPRCALGEQPAADPDQIRGDSVWAASIKVREAQQRRFKSRDWVVGERIRRSVARTWQITLSAPVGSCRLLSPQSAGIACTTRVFVGSCRVVSDPVGAGLLVRVQPREPPGSIRARRSCGTSGARVPLSCSAPCGSWSRAPRRGTASG